MATQRKNLEGGGEQVPGRKEEAFFAVKKRFSEKMNWSMGKAYPCRFFLFIGIIDFLFAVFGMPAAIYAKRSVLVTAWIGLAHRLFHF